MMRKEITKFSEVRFQGVSHYIFFVMKYNYNYFGKNVMEYHYSTVRNSAQNDFTGKRDIYLVAY